MRKLTKLPIKLAFLIFILNSCNIIGIKKPYSEFEGTIAYNNSIICGKEIARDSNYFKLFGENETLRISNGNYRIDYPAGNKFTKVLYNMELNNYYMFYTDGSVKYFSAINESDSILKITRNIAKVIICGYSCESIKFDFNKFSMTYYYSKDLKINPILFKNHKYNYINKFYTISKSMYLKSELEFEDMKYIKTATKVERVKVDKEEFIIPLNANLFR